MKTSGTSKLESLEVEMFRYRHILDGDFADRWTSENRAIFRNLKLTFHDRFENPDIETPREFNERLFQEQGSHRPVIGYHPVSGRPFFRF